MVLIPLTSDKAGLADLHGRYIPKLDSVLRDLRILPHKFMRAPGQGKGDRD